MGVRVVVTAVVVMTCVWGVRGHGRLMDPPARNSMWRLGFDNPVNYDDNQLYCGGREVQWGQHGGRCGVCGDAYDGQREHEAGGRYANGVIGRTYRQGQTINITVHLTANHQGWFELRLCPIDDVRTRVTQACLDRHLLARADGSGPRLEVPGGRPNVFLNYRVALPPGLACTQCVMQWKYRTGNTWNKDENSGAFCLGCGPQEEFYNCADIAILPDHSAEVKDTEDADERGRGHSDSPMEGEGPDLRTHRQTGRGSQRSHGSRGRPALTAFSWAVLTPDARPRTEGRAAPVSQRGSLNPSQRSSQRQHSRRQGAGLSPWTVGGKRRWPKAKVTYRPWVKVVMRPAMKPSSRSKVEATYSFKAKTSPWTQDKPTSKSKVKVISQPKTKASSWTRFFKVGTRHNVNPISRSKVKDITRRKVKASGVPRWLANVKAVTWGQRRQQQSGRSDLGKVKVANGSGIASWRGTIRHKGWRHLGTRNNPPVERSRDDPSTPPPDRRGTPCTIRAHEERRSRRMRPVVSGLSARGSLQCASRGAGPGMDAWCSHNCQARFCPPRLCLCRQGHPRRQGHQGHRCRDGQLSHQGHQDHKGQLARQGHQGQRAPYLVVTSRSRSHRRGVGGLAGGGEEGGGPHRGHRAQGHRSSVSRDSRSKDNRSSVYRGYGSSVPKGYRSSVYKGYGSSVPKGYRSSVYKGYGSSVAKGYRSSLYRGYGSYGSSVPKGYRSSVYKGYGSSVPKGYGSSVYKGYGSSVPKGYRSSVYKGYGSSVPKGYRSSVYKGYGSSVPKGYWSSVKKKVSSKGLSVTYGLSSPEYGSGSYRSYFATDFRSSVPRNYTSSNSRSEDFRSSLAKDNRPHTGKDNRPHTGKDNRPHTGKDSRPHTGKDSRPHTGKDNRPHTGKDSRPHTGKDNRPHTGKDNSPHTGKDNRPHTGKDNTPHTGKDNTPHTGKDNTPHTGKDNTPHTGKDNRPHKGKDNTPHTGKDNTPHTGKDNTPHTGKDNTPHTGKDNTPHTGKNHGVSGGCHATGIYSGIRHYDTWCRHNCARSMCPLLICVCVT